ncbi:MAG: hypothetical protein A2945_00520 [Candidatus Liptonbacteria bacterium RIFCSPLOWO2_01_FULL_52_25]|uniref:Glutamate dehydrogenase n=1 Tax=Candidatus Liptonbacteria bacterium RIFCSPLOWO2_01_FULL_52_25 TaxID=1798650 RepID=A0A1G2CHT8_9BACT|nr:MAG: hypothetical protein A2945_00520 [Candidatus Liptonbacteria bacterium RIFCSPLOWO2_01_FULL_52_25]
MLASHLDNILVRIEKANDALNIRPLWLREKLRGFKLDWECDIEAEMDDGSMRQFHAVRIWHRSPHVDQPHKGGLRYHPFVNADMMKAHAIEMSLKLWLINVEMGGAKGGIVIDPSKHSPRELKNVTEAYVDEADERNILGPFRDVPAPDVGTTPTVMHWMRQRYAQRRRSREDARFAGVVTGKPVGYGYDGIPGRNEATGCGLITALQYVLEQSKYPTRCPRIAIMGFGNVGFHVAMFAAEVGFPIVAVSDVHGGIFRKDGIDFDELRRYFEATKAVLGMPGTRAITNEELLTLDVDVVIPAALEHVITKQNACALQAPIILEGANGPTTPEADEILSAKGKIVVPDIAANAGGVTVSFFEWARNVNKLDSRVPRPEGGEVLFRMNEILTNAMSEVWENAARYKTSLRHAAYITAINRVMPLFRAKHLAE